MEKASFARLNKLFKIDVAEWAYNILLLDKNFQAFAHSSLVLNEHFVLKDPHFFKIARLVDFEAHQARLEEYEKKCYEGTLRQAPTASR